MFARYTTTHGPVDRDETGFPLPFRIQVSSLFTTHCDMTSPHMDAPPWCDTNWLVVISAGRAGSTTILDMLNTVPFISLSGELAISPETEDHSLGLRLSDPRADCAPRSVIGRLFSTYDLSLSPGLTGSYGTARYAVPQAARLKHHMCGWLRDMMLSTPSRHYFGFKEMVHCIEPLDQALALLGPNVRIIRSFRRNVAKQLNSAFWKTIKSASTLLQRHTAEMFRATSSYPNVFDLPLEEFSVAKFNELLSFLDIGGCNFTRVLHANDGARGDGYAGPGEGATRGLLDGVCSMRSPSSISPPPRSPSTLTPLAAAAPTPSLLPPPLPPIHRLGPLAPVRGTPIGSCEGMPVLTTAPCLFHRCVVRRWIQRETRLPWHLGDVISIG